MLLRLEALLEQLPRLNDAELLQPHLESAALPALPAELLAHFQLRHRVWKADVGALARDAAGATADPTAAHVAAVARVLDGDDAAIADAVGAAGWHAKLLAKLLYAQPTLFRWQAAMRDRARPIHGDREAQRPHQTRRCARRSRRTSRHVSRRRCASSCLNARRRRPRPTRSTALLSLR